MKAMSAIQRVIVVVALCFIGSAFNCNAQPQVDENRSPVVRLVHPFDGAVFVAPPAILVIASAHDPGGHVVLVEFYANDVLIGVAEPRFPSAPGVPDRTDPPWGLIHPFSIRWQAPSPGTHELTAVATDNDGAKATSDPVKIEVLESPLRSVVSIEVVDPEGSEEASDPAVFRICRTGSTDVGLDVFYKLDGTAENGTDYSELPLRVTIPIGAPSVEVVVKPIDDNMAEKAESVVLKLMPPRSGVSDAGRPPERWDGWYLVGTPGAGRVVIVDNDRQENMSPRVKITQPENGQAFVAPADIEIDVEVCDPDGWVPVVGFYAGDELIGEQQMTFIVEPAPGQPQTFHMTWEDVGPGAFAIRAKATDNLGARALSEPVRVLVDRKERPPVVSIVVADPVASEPGVLTVVDTATFVVRRTGSLALPLTVDYAIGGSAITGVDYDELSGKVKIEEGEAAAQIIVNPIADDLAEGTETVVIELVPPDCAGTDPSGPDCYSVGGVGSARAKIMDRPGSDNKPPKAAIARPRPGEVFQAPARIEIVVAAYDRDGRVEKVEFYADDVKIGEQLATNPTGGIESGDEQTFTIEWDGASVGKHVLTAKAYDNEGAPGVTKPVMIAVIEHSLPPYVNIVAIDPFAAEGAGDASPNTATFRISRTGATGDALMVFYAISGSAENGVDYEGIETTVTIPAGSSSATVVIKPLEDELTERFETVVLTLETAPILGPIEPYRVGSRSRAGAVIADKDWPGQLGRDARDGSLHVSLGGENGMPYRIEASDDLVNWFPVGEGIVNNGRVHYVEPGLSEARCKFYRVRPIAAAALDFGD